MAIERIHEPVKVRADFQGGEVTPVLVRRGTQVHRVVSVNARWVDRAGRHPRFGFAVKLETGDAWRLVLRTTDLTWWLELVSTA